MEEILSVQNLKEYIFPNLQFWEEYINVNVLMEAYCQKTIRKQWVSSLSWCQWNLLVKFLKISKKTIRYQDFINFFWQNPEKFITYFLLQSFCSNKSSNIILEIAKKNLDKDFIYACLRGNEECDKLAILFAIFNFDAFLIKRIYFMDLFKKNQVHSFALQGFYPKRFSDFLNCFSNNFFKNTYEKCKFDIFKSKNHFYLFMEQESQEKSFFLEKQSEKLGKQRIFFDFFEGKNRMDVSANNIPQALETLKFLFKQQDLSFLPLEMSHHSREIHNFLGACIQESDPKIRLFEMQFRSSYLKNNTKIILSANPMDGISEELKTLQKSIGDIMGDVSLIEEVRLLYENKKIALFFKKKSEDSNRFLVEYSSQSFSRIFQESFQSWMKSTYGLTVSNYAKCTN